MKKNISIISTIVLSLFALSAHAVVMAAQPVVGDNLNGVAVAFQTSPLPPDLHMLKNAKLSSRSYIVARNSDGQNQYFQIFYVDANNDGSLEYVITQSPTNVAPPVRVVDVFKMHNNEIHFLGFDRVAAQSLGVSSPLVPCKNWYCNLAQPAFVYEGGSWFMRFKADNDQICQYLWKNGAVINQPNMKGCVGAKAPGASVMLPTPGAPALTVPSVSLVSVSSQ